MKKSKAYLGIAIALLMAVLLVLPAMAAEGTEKYSVQDSGAQEETDNPDDQNSPDEQKEPADTSGYNGFRSAPNTEDWYYYTDGQVDTSVTEVKKGTVNGVSGWWNVINGKVTPGVTVAKNANGWWYIDENGMVDFSANTVAKNENGWWYILNGKVQFDFTGLANYRNENGWWYIVNGRVDFTHNGVDKNKNGWWYVENGKVQFDYTGVANYENENGWWYIKNGMVDFTANTVAKNVNGWWYVLGGKVQFGFTGLANYRNENGWWYIRDGKVDFSHNGVDKNNNGWYYVVGGKVDFSYTGVANYENENGWWYIRDGRVDFSANTVAQNIYGWWYVLGGKVQFDYTGIANYKNENGWWYIKDGMVDFSYTGVSSNNNGHWYVNGGRVDFSYSGLYTQNSVTYSIQDGWVDPTSVMVVNSTFSGDLLNMLTAKKGTLLSRTLTENEFDQIINELMKSYYVKNVSYRLITANFVWNGGPRWDCSSTSLYLLNYYLLTYDEAYQAAKQANPFASSSTLVTTALAAVGQKAEGAYAESGSLYMVNAASQAVSWGNPVYTYQNIGTLTASNPGNLRYGDLLFYGYNNGSSVTITHVAIYLGQYYRANGDTGYYQLENTSYNYAGLTEGRSDGVRISPFRAKGTSSVLVHAARIF